MFTEADYDQRSISVTIAPGTVVQQFNVNITNDNIIECTETFNLSISIEKTLCGLSSSNSNAQVVIVDDDGEYHCNCITHELYYTCDLLSFDGI